MNIATAYHYPWRKNLINKALIFLTAPLPVQSAKVNHNSFETVSRHSPTYTFHVPQAAQARTLQNIWNMSQEADGITFRPHDGSWSLAGWATASYLLLEDGEPIGVAAIRFTPGADEAAEVRLALLPSHRQSLAAWYLIEAAIALVFVVRASKLHLYLPIGATWASETIRAYGFRQASTLEGWVVDFFKGWTGKELFRNGPVELSTYIPSN